MGAPIRLPTEETIAEAARILRDGGLVVFPTETVYGLGAHALDARAVARIFEVKNRPRFDPLIVHIADLAMLEGLCETMFDSARRLIDRFWPGPLTVVLPKRSVVPDIVKAGLPTVAVRWPSHPVAQALIRAAGIPVAAPSANPFGRLSPTRVEHLDPVLRSQVDLVIDGGPCEFGVESTIVYVTEEAVTVLRLGALPVEVLEAVVGPVTLQIGSLGRPMSPGQLPRHYAPRTPVRVLRPGETSPPSSHRVGYLAFREAPPDRSFQAVEVLSPTGDLREAAARLFDCLHRLDEAGVDVIYAEPVPEVGLGRAIMDRLRRAATDVGFFPSED
ncbi:MAG: L-threonylcarbamoyladenylate synthase [Acidobacteria bacterium]|nr:L-threonylcarbamoyladenylate synthase [Acidobacteriota bacterium]MDW7983250.1 L-threonylcarbamoyladenylate synthase [Acidobacteriota bacterium]